LGRIPPAHVRRMLRVEAGFGCPIPDCGNPYLQWHHFDPPWAHKQHHDPNGMIALCSEHHAKAGAGAFTMEQLREYKRQGCTKEVRGRFDWMRKRHLTVLGCNFAFDCKTALEIAGEPVVWFNPDEAGYQLLNVRMPTASSEERIALEDNYWIKRGTPIDLTCPPSGRTLHVKYENGDTLGLEFVELVDAQAAARRYSFGDPSMWPIQFPITAVEIHCTLPGTDLILSPTIPLFGMQGCMALSLPVAFGIGDRGPAV
jgi:hypothetical protein